MRRAEILEVYVRLTYTALLLFCLSLCAGPALGADTGAVVPHKPAPASPKAQTSPKAKTAPKTTKAPSAVGTTAASPPRAIPRANAHTMSKAIKPNAWYLDGTPRKARGSLWEQGVEGKSLTRDRTEISRSKRQAEEARQQQAVGPARKKGVDTQKGINSALDEISAYERPPVDPTLALGLNKPGTPSVQVTKDRSSWRNEASGPGTVGQDVMTTRRNVVGAYADVVKDEDLRVSVGPELHIPDTETTSNHIAPQRPESSTLGVGMKWQWDF